MLAPEASSSQPAAFRSLWPEFNIGNDDFFTTFFEARIIAKICIFAPILPEICEDSIERVSVQRKKNEMNRKRNGENEIQ